MPRNASGQFTPGVSGNPKGRPPGVPALAASVRKKIGKDGYVVVGIFLDIAQDPKASRADRMTAAAWLADRGFGKATQLIAGDESHAPLRIDRPATADPTELAKDLLELGLLLPADDTVTRDSAP